MYSNNKNDDSAARYNGRKLVNPQMKAGLVSACVSSGPTGDFINSVGDLLPDQVHS